MARRYEIENPNKNNRRVTTGVVAGPREGVHPRVLLGRRHPTPAEVAVSESTPKTGHIRVLLVWPCGSPTYGAGRKSSSNLVQPNQLHEITCGYRNKYYIESGFLLRGTLPQETHGGRGGGHPAAFSRRSLSPL